MTWSQLTAGKVRVARAIGCVVGSTAGDVPKFIAERWEHVALWNDDFTRFLRATWMWEATP